MNKFVFLFQIEIRSNSSRSKDSVNFNRKIFLKSNYLAIWKELNRTEKRFQTGVFYIFSDVFICSDFFNQNF